MSEFSILDPFQAATIPLGDWVQSTLNFLVHHFRDLFRAIRWPIDQVLNGIEFTLKAYRRRSALFCRRSWAGS